MMPGATLGERRKELRKFKFRLVICMGVAVALFGVLALRFFYLQVVEHDHFTTLAENNRITIVPVVPNRGLILDRNGVMLANNYSAYTLEITPSRVQNLDQTLDELAKIVEITPRDRKRFKKLLEESRNFESLPVRTRLSEIEVARFAVNRFRFPGVEISARLFRNYPKGSLLSHVVGYIGRINDKDLELLEDAGLMANYRGSDHMGKVGIEQSYEKELHGKTGLEQLETDATGRAIRTLSRTEPVSGNDLILTLDTNLQEMSTRIFGERRGALVAIEPATGEIMALVSQPGYDPNLFVDGIDQANWDSLNDSPDRPLVNRALRGLYPPGSTIKPFMALAALYYNKRTSSSTISDPGFFAFPGGNHRYRDWKVGGHGLVDLRRSIVISCDTYYYGVANDLGIDNIHRFLSRFGFGKKTGVDMDGELPGVLPSREWKQKKFKQDWYPGETVISGIGQGYNLMTPLQLAHAISVIANNGVIVRPHLVRAIRDSKTGQVHEIAPQAGGTIGSKPEHLAFVRQALVEVTRKGGTAASAGLNVAYPFAGKTGTAQVVGIRQNERYVESKVAERNRDHALFIAYAPADDPRIALSVLVENGGHGAETAAPVARQVLDYYLLGAVPTTTDMVAKQENEHD
jgi:penicillin-binding protein 2